MHPPKIGDFNTALQIDRLGMKTIYESCVLYMKPTLLCSCEDFLRKGATLQVGELLVLVTATKKTTKPF